MKQQFLEIIRQLEAVNVAESPNYQTLVALAFHLNACYPDPKYVASHIKLNVNEDFVNDDKLFNTTLDAYVNVLNKVWKQLKLDFGEEDAKPIFFAMIPTMSIVYSYE